MELTLRRWASSFLRFEGTVLPYVLSLQSSMKKKHWALEYEVDRSHLNVCKHPVTQRHSLENIIPEIRILSWNVI